jgi:RNA polymerase sigma-70 factor (ECF subfamily)
MATAPASKEKEEALLAAAQDGSEDAFGSLVGSYQGELKAHCYRMLGSAQDSEDALQEALLRAWKSLGRFEGRSSLRSWLYTISTNTCLDQLGKRKKHRVLPVDYGPSGVAETGPQMPVVEQVWIEPFPDAEIDIPDGVAGPEARYEQRESLELAFVASLQLLAPNQRAVLILREVLGFSAQETADMLETSVQSVNSALQRARKTIDDHVPEESQQQTLRALGDEKAKAIVDAFSEAMRSGDVEAVVGLLADDATWTMPPMVEWYRGTEELIEFLKNGPLTGEWDWKHIPARANGALAYGVYAWYPPDECYRPFAMEVFTLEGEKVKQVDSFIVKVVESDDPEAYAKFPHMRNDPEMTKANFLDFGLPDRLD